MTYKNCFIICNLGSVDIISLCSKFDFGVQFYFYFHFYYIFFRRTPHLGTAAVCRFVEA